MDERWWFTLKNPFSMTEYIFQKNPSNRKLRLLTTAIFRWNVQEWCDLDKYEVNPYKNQHLEAALEGELIADSVPGHLPRVDSAGFCPLWSDSSLQLAAIRVFGNSVRSVAIRRDQTVIDTSVIRCIFGNPTRPVSICVSTGSEGGSRCPKCRNSLQNTTILGSFYIKRCASCMHVWEHASWIHKNNNRIPKFAQEIYDNRKFELLPILADLLEEAGCETTELILHCRNDKIHAKGCWVIDLLLDKE